MLVQLEADGGHWGHGTDLQAAAAAEQGQQARGSGGAAAVVNCKVGTQLQAGAGSEPGIHPELETVREALRGSGRPQVSRSTVGARALLTCAAFERELLTERSTAHAPLLKHAGPAVGPQAEVGLHTAGLAAVSTPCLAAGAHSWEGAIYARSCKRSI